ncbi:MAG: radical SAM protein [Kiritimatiellae bacterium]|nr:radical SAM protein [Kiritimatiellia bacterium]
MQLCTLCPRNCRTDRAEKRGVCGVPQDIYISKIMLHKWEEPCISGSRGSGAVFFCGCPLGCRFCQNGDISRLNNGAFAGQRKFSEAELVSAMLELQEKGAHNVNFVSPTQYTDTIIRVVAEAKARGLSLPIVWNTGGYEKAEVIRSLEGTVDVFLTDMKYYSSELSGNLSSAPDYYSFAFPSLLEMCRIAGKPEYSDGIMTRGVIVRHLVLPGSRHDSEEILRRLADAGLQSEIILSLMSQYTPDFFKGCSDEKLDRTMRRRVTTFEYNAVRDLAADLGFDGFGQERESAQKKYTPDWGF